MRIIDWSSDVCSSDRERTEPDAAGCQFADLVDEVAHRAAGPIEFPHDQRVAGAQISQCFAKPVPVGPGTRCLIVENTFASRALQGVMLERSLLVLSGNAALEERRVGNECVSPCRSRLSP